jgi:hypothetical protein
MKSFIPPLQIVAYAEGPCSCTYIACLRNPNGTGTTTKEKKEEDLVYTQGLGLEPKTGISHKDAAMKFVVQNNLMEISIEFNA